MNWWESGEERRLEEGERERKLHFDWNMWVNTFQLKEREVTTPAKSVRRNVADPWQLTLMFQMLNCPTK